MGNFGLIDVVGNTFGYSRVIVYGPDGKIKFPTGGGGGSGTVTSIGMTVPSGFNVTPSAITVSGTFAITGAGTSAQYIDGTGALQTFPTVPSFTPSALTKIDDTNVTLTLGGTPATSLLQAVSLTLGWTGQLSTSRGGTGLATIGTDGQLIRVNTGATALEYFTPTYLTAVPTLQQVTDQGSTTTNSITLDDTVNQIVLDNTGIYGPSPNIHIFDNVAGASASLQSNVLILQDTGNPVLTAAYYTNEISIANNSGSYVLTYPSQSGTFALTSDIPSQYNPTAGTGISITGAYPNQTISNTGLTSVPDLQAVLIAGSTLTQDNIIDGGGFTQQFNNNYKFSVSSEQLIALEVNDGTQTAQLELYPQAGYTALNYDDGSSGTQIKMTGAKMYINTPGYASALNGDVLTLIDNFTGEVEYQTPTTTTGDSLSPLLLMGG